MHHHRSEHWVVVSGTAKISLDDNDMLLSKWQSTYIPIWTKHRLENVWKVDLHIIESQIWDYLEEDDIVRFDDEYGRI
jgi:mannose-6-phosphate isomerase-like protein (cupin superfamily)